MQGTCAQNCFDMERQCHRDEQRRHKQEQGCSNAFIHQRRPGQVQEKVKRYEQEATTQQQQFPIHHGEEAHVAKLEKNANRRQAAYVQSRIKLVRDEQQSALDVNGCKQLFQQALEIHLTEKNLCDRFLRGQLGAIYLEP